MEYIKNIIKTDSGLSAEVWLPFAKTYVPATFDELFELTDAQLSLIKSLQWSEQVTAQLEKALYLACESFKHAAGLSEPKLNNESSVWQYARISRVRIDEESTAEENQFIVLQISAAWEQEHAYEAVVKNGNELVYLGDFLYYTSTGYEAISAIDGNYARR